MHLFNGKEQANILDARIKNYILTTGIPKKKLLIIYIGTNLASEKYINIKQKYCTSLNLECEVLALPESLSDKEIGDTVSHYFARDDIYGGIIQMPLPHKSLLYILDKIPEEKDIDCLNTASNHARFSPVVRAFNRFVEVTGEDLMGKRVYVIGEGRVVGRPIISYARSKGALVSSTENYQRGQKITADFVILSAGVPNLVSPSDISEKAHVVDMSSNVVDGKIVGDLDRNGSTEHLGWLSPSPGGLGPLVVRYLIMNFLGI